MVATYPIGSNTYVPNHEASGSMIVNYSRNVRDFAVNRYTQIVPVTQDTGFYLQMTAEEAARVVTDDEFNWPDASDFPEVLDGTESFDFKAYKTRRRGYGFRLGGKAVKQATWDIVAQHSRIAAQKAMTNRTRAVVSAMTTSGNYDSAHVADVTSGITGNTGTWAASTTARSDIKRSIYHGMEQILLATLGVVNQEDLHLVLSPKAAHAIALSQEIIDYIKGSPHALAQIKGEVEGRNRQWGLPDTLYGIPLEVEKTVRVTTRKGIATTKQFIFPGTSAALVARPGALEAPEGGPSFSTITNFVYEDMTVENKEDIDNRVTKGRVVDDFATVVTAPASGFLFTGITA